MAARIPVVARLLALFIGVCLPSLATAQTTAFTYQGRLTDGGVPANGSYDVRFILYDAAAAGSQVGTTIYTDDAPIGSGLFSATLDFGAASWPGANRWLEVAVRPGAVSNADRNPLTYTILNPRHQMSSTPYAIRARDADTIDGYDSSVFLTGVPNPLALTNSLAGPVISGTNATGSGVYGSSNGPFGIGMWGDGTGPTGIGVFGSGAGLVLFSGPSGVCGSSPTGAGVAGNTSTGIGMAATTHGASGTPRAMVASTEAAAGKGVVATNTHVSQNTSVELASRISGAANVTLNGSPVGVMATSPQVAIYARSEGASHAIYGESSSSNGVVGVSETGVGVRGVASQMEGAAVLAWNSNALGDALRIENGGIRVTDATIGSITSPVFIHRSHAGNISGNTTEINHALTNGDPNAILIITPNWNPGGVGGTYNANPIGVFYNNGTARWAIFNQNLATMTVNQSFNVLVIKAGPAPKAPTTLSPTSSSNLPVDPQLGGIQISGAKPSMSGSK